MKALNWKGPDSHDCTEVGVPVSRMADFMESVRDAINKKDLHWANPSIAKRRVFLTVVFANYNTPSHLLMVWEGSPTKMEIMADLQGGPESCGGLVTVSGRAFRQSNPSQRFKFNAVRGAVVDFINDLGVTDFSRVIVITPVKE